MPTVSRKEAEFRARWEAAAPETDFDWDNMRHPSPIHPAGLAILAVSAIVTVLGWAFFFREVWRWMR